MPMNETMWTTVIDEKADTGEYEPAAIYSESPDDNPHIKSRRALQSNGAGFPIIDRTWEYDGAQVVQMQQRGFAEQNKYDCSGRLVERRTKGWSAAGITGNGGNQDDDGLIFEFEYGGTDCYLVNDECVTEPADPQCVSNREPIVAYVKQGTGGTKYKIREVEREQPHHREVVTKEISFAEPSGAPQDTIYQYEYHTKAGVEEKYWPMKSKTVIGPAAKIGLNSGKYNQIQKTIWDEQGRETWSGQGLHCATANPPYFCFYAAHAQYDALGRKIRQVVDPDPNDYPYPTEPTPWVRAFPDSALANPLNLETIFAYESALGVTHITYPNDRETRIVYTFDSESKATYQWIYKDLVAGQNGYQILGPIGVTCTINDQLVWKKTVDGAIFDGVADGVHADWEDHVLTETEPQYDSSGNIVGVVQAGEAVDPLRAFVSYGGLGGPSREQSPDGTIKRYMYDDWGRVTHTYQGTKDIHDNWGTHPDPGDPVDDNMVLVEKREYGTGIKDADKLTIVRQFRDKPADQYDEDPNVPSNEDDIGWIAVTEYDWRMRPVAVSRYASENGPGNPVLKSLTVTWLDHQDRTRFVAEYDHSVVSVPDDPRAAAPDATEPAPEDILANPTTNGLLSLTETRYNARGQVEETLAYDVSDASGHAYTRTLTYYDQANRPIEVHSPGAPVQRYVYNAKGQQVVTSQVVQTAGGEVELTRTRTAYDKNDRAIRTEYAERRADATGVGALDASNSIRTFTEIWYDDAGKVIATANYGTSSGTFEYSTPPWQDIDEPQAVPPAASTATMLITLYSYDESGRQIAVQQPDGSITRSQYDGLGRLRLQTENAGTIAAPTPPDQRRMTAYRYDDQGRLDAIAAVLPEHLNGAVNSWTDVDWGNPNGTLQITELHYGDGATVVNALGTAISTNLSWVREVRYPHRTTGAPDPDSAIYFEYYSDGSVARRVSALGAGFFYKYDEAGRVTEVNVTYPPPLELCPQPPALDPPDRITRIVYSYDDAGRLEFATAYTRVDGVETLLTQNEYSYKPVGDLEWERQSLRNPTGTNSPQIDYDWDFQSAYDGGGNMNRLDSMTYPKRLQSTVRRTIDLQYGDAAGPNAGIDEALGRVVKLTDSLNGASTTYQYGGIARRAKLTLGASLIVQSLIGSAGLSGLDTFGRTIDLDYKSGSNTVHQYQYGYDLSGNRTHAGVIQAPSVWQSGNPISHNDRSYAYAYDDLQRLTDADLGILNSGNTIQSPVRAVDWSLDNLGNWTGVDGSQPVPGVTITTAQGVTTVDHAVHRDNALDDVTITPPSGPAVQTANVVNRDDNLVFDGSYYYQYDAWNRLVQVNTAGTLTAQTFNSDGVLVQCPVPQGEPPGPTPGPWIARYVYDGLGRLVEKQTPVIGGQNEIRREEYHYDGVRRIQEFVRREVTVIVVPEGEGGEPNPEGEPGDPVPGSPGLEEPVEIEPLSPLAPGEVVTALPAGWDQREYVWGPEYVDELAWQIDKNGKPFYALLDANYNVMACVAGTAIPAAGGDPSGTQTAPAGTVFEQYVWSPYGELLSRDVLDRTPGGANEGKLVIDAGTGTAGASLAGIRNRVGHQGLFFERFDGLNTDPALVPTDALSGRGKGFYYNRWRWYDAQAGRFVSQDMNSTGMAGSQLLPFHGQPVDANVESYNSQMQYNSGMSLFAYLASNPLSGTDALGLYDDSDYEDAIGDHAAYAMYVLGTLNESARMVSVGLNTTLTIAKGFLPGSGLADAFSAVQVLSSGQGGFWEALDIAMVALPGISAAKNALGVAFRGGFLSRVLGRAKGLGSKALVLCKIGSCFTAGTMIATPTGSVPIENLQLGDFVLSRHEDDPTGLLVPRRVTSLFSNASSELLWITFETGMTIAVTPEHPFWEVRRGAVYACELAVLDLVLTSSKIPQRIVDIYQDSQRSAVFNIEVDGTQTYFAESVWVHNCPRISKLAPDWFTKGANIHWGKIELSIRPGNAGIPVVKPVFSSQADEAQAAIKGTYEALGGEFRGQLRNAVERAVEYARSNGKHDKAFEFKMLLKALE